MNGQNKFSFSYLLFFCFCVLIGLSPFVVYHFVLRSEVLSIYAKMDQKPDTNQREIPSKRKQRTIRVLSIGGGGVQGIIPAHVLNYLEKTSGKKISELFDVIMGSSTGSIPSVLLTIPDKTGVSKYSADDVLDLYLHHSEELFNAPVYHKILTLNGMIGPKYKLTSRYELLKDYMDGIFFDQLNTNVVIPAYDIYSRSPEVFYNWQIPNFQNMNFSILDLVLGASSPIGMFPSFVFDPSGKRYALSDGSIFVNNPALAAALISMGTYPGKKYVLVSLGTEHLKPLQQTSVGADYSLLGSLKNHLDISNDSSDKFDTFILREQFPFDLNVYHYSYPVDEMSHFSDDVSPSNLARLNNEGKSLVEMNRQELDDLVQILLHP